MRCTIHIRTTISTAGYDGNPWEGQVTDAGIGVFVGLVNIEEKESGNKGVDRSSYSISRRRKHIRTDIGVGAVNSI